MKTDPFAESTGVLADERLIAFARVLLAITSFVAIYIDPTEPARFSTIVYVLLVTYVVESVAIAIALATARRLPPLAAGAVHVADLAWFGILTWLTGATSSPLWPFVIYVLVAAAYRWGFAGTVTTTAVGCAVLFAEAIWQASSTGLDPSLRLEVNRFIVRTSYTANAGVLLAGLAAYQKQLQLESATVSRLLTRLGSETGIHAALELATRDLLHTFGAKGIVVAVRETETGRSFAWVLTATDGHGLRRLRLNARVGERYLFDGPAAFALKHRRKGASFIRALNSIGGVTSRAGVFDGPPLPYKYATAATISSYEQWFARVFLLDPRAGTGVYAASDCCSGSPSA
jgi:hypothetical protein